MLYQLQKSFMKLLKPILFLFVGLFAFAALADVRQGLVSYWSMEGLDVGGMVPDEGFGNHLTPNGAVEFVADPVRGNVLSLGGVPSDAYLSIFHSTNNLETGLPISASGTYTIMMWVKAPAQTATYLYSEGYSEDNNPIFIIQTGQAAANNDKLDVVENDCIGDAGVCYGVPRRATSPERCAGQTLQNLGLSRIWRVSRFQLACVREPA
jgi:hypothetical protein